MSNYNKNKSPAIITVGKARFTKQSHTNVHTADLSGYV